MLTPNSLFSYANLAAMLGWALLVLAPRWRVTKVLVLSGAWPLALALAYAALITTHYLDGHGSEGGFGSLAQVAALFRDPWALLAGWVHYLCFDLFTGTWEVRDAQRRGLSHWLVVPALALTFLFGPVGLLVYFITRQLFSKAATVSATV